MNPNTFIGFILLMAVVLSYGYGEFRDIFSVEESLRVEVAQLRSSLDQEMLQKLVAEHQLVEFKQQVATLLPNSIYKKGEKNFPLRRLASVTQKQKYESFQLQSAKNVYQQATKAFKAGQYKDSNKLFTKLIERYPFSANLAEAYFLLAEGNFQMRDFEVVLKTASRMVELFPESELTGFTLLRVGRIYESQYRKEDALEIYQTILRSFPHRDLATQANTSLRAVEL